MVEKIQCSVGVFAYNEEKNIANILTALLHQKLQTVEIVEIIVVSSASTDKTDQIVQSFIDKHPIIRLIQEKERNGKSAAINLFISQAISKILVIESADTIPESDVIEKLVKPFKNKLIGMTGGRPVPENSKSTFIGFAVNLLWSLHHEMAMQSPKLGEMVAFRRIFEEIPSDSAVDEASIEALIRENSYQLLYISSAIIHNKGPETIFDFIKQRRRIAAGHLWLKENHAYQVTSQDPFLMLFLFIKSCFKNPKDIIKIIAVAKLEIFCRLLGTYDYKVKRINPFKWNTIDSSKSLKYKNRD
ncbi:MAG TPA: glycosyltransferase [Candidatus Cloacimonadota bacterium]|nr:glycosyltransferase [Candidatus Cloacimonadota bacterium]HOD54949.1 glycosyltransferase [Candidatus Cloacimonadota bacterium]HPM00953.1 glycosyltransferase [Candidatus Cloacimonadota bacterium]